MASIRMPGSLVRRRHGTIWYRLQVPPKLRPLLGWEITRSLKTADWDEAKSRAPAVATWAQQKLADARAQLDQQQQERWHEDALDALQDAYEASLSPAWRAWDYALRQDKIDLGEPEEKWRQPFSQTPLAKLLGISRALDVDQAIERAAAGGPAVLEQQAGPAVTISGLLEGWATEREPPARTLDAWTRIINRLIKHIGHEDSEKLTRREIVGWKDALLESGLSRKSVEMHLTAVSTIFNHALVNERLTRTDNPVKAIRVAKRDDPAEKRRPFTEAEAVMVIKAARNEAKASMRWLPISCWRSPEPGWMSCVGSPRRTSGPTPRSPGSWAPKPAGSSGSSRPRIGASRRNGRALGRSRCISRSWTRASSSTSKGYRTAARCSQTCRPMYGAGEQGRRRRCWAAASGRSGSSTSGPLLDTPGAIGSRISAVPWASRRMFTTLSRATSRVTLARPMALATRS
jgi:hypothetical protein